MEIAKRYALTFMIAALGVLCGIALWHLWDDHRLMDEIRAARIAQTAAQAQQIQQFQQQQRAAQTPKVGP